MQIQKVLIKLVISTIETLQEVPFQKRKCRFLDTQQFISTLRGVVRRNIGQRHVSRKRKMYQNPKRKMYQNPKRKGDQNVIRSAQKVFFSQK